MENIKAFLEADALRTQGEWQNHCGTVWVPDVCEGPYGEPEQYQSRIADSADNDANFIAAASRIAPDIRAMQDAFERVCEALEESQDSFAYIGAETAEKMCKSALAAAAPYRKQMGGGNDAAF